MNPRTNQPPEYYKNSGQFTKPFLPESEKQKLLKKMENKSGVEKIDVIYDYIHKNKNTLLSRAFKPSQKYQDENKFNRTAEEVWNGGKMTGCTDYALVFSSISRQCDIPTTLLSTIGQDCADKIQKEEKLNGIIAHSFCECYVDGKWVLADPTNKITEQEYNPENLQLTGSHNVYGEQNFIAYDRTLDIEHVKDENVVNDLKNGTYRNPTDYYINGYTIPKLLDIVQGNEPPIENIREIQPVIEQISQQELEDVGYTEEKPKIEIIDYKKEDENTYESQNEDDEELVWKKPDNIK